MLQDGAHIQRLKVRAHRRRGVPMVQSAVEDAFRTQLSAAGPAVQRGLLVIRHIDLGPIGSRSEQSAINQKLAAILREAAAHSRLKPDENYRDADAAFFADPLAPVLDVADAISRNSAIPQSWPYRAILGEAIFKSQSQLLEAIISRQLDTPQAGPAIRLILQRLGARLFEVVEQVSGPTQSNILTVLYGGTVVAGTTNIGRADLGQLAHDLCLLDRTNPILHPAAVHNLRISAESKVLNIALAVDLSGPSRPVCTRRIALANETLAYLVRTSRSQTVPIRLAGTLARQIEAFLETASERQVAAALVGADGETGQGLPNVLQHIEHTFKPNTRAPIDQDVRELEPELTEPDEAVNTPTEPYDGIALARSAFEASRYAGITYLIALIDALYGKWLNQSDHLARATGQHLLHQIMERLGLHAEEPSQLFLNSLGDLPPANGSPCEFALRPEMLPEMAASANPIRISAVTGHAGWRMATLGRMTIATWQGRATGQARAILRSGQPVNRTQTREFSTNAMLHSCELGLRRFLRLGPQVHWRDLVCRNGGLAHTSTQLDGSFDAGVVDLSIRRWALDRSPGWCAWLWRVVTIYYDFGHDEFGEQDAG